MHNGLYGCIVCVQPSYGLSNWGGGGCRCIVCICSRLEWETLHEVVVVPVDDYDLFFFIIMAGVRRWEAARTFTGALSWAFLPGNGGLQLDVAPAGAGDTSQYAGQNLRCISLQILICLKKRRPGDDF